MPPYRMDNYRLISGHGSSESRESFLHNGRDDEGSTDNKYDGGHRLSYRGASFARIWWEKRSLMVVLAISLTTNLVCGVLVFMLLRSVKSQTCVDSELSDFTSYGQWMDLSSRLRKFRFSLKVIQLDSLTIPPYVSHGPPGMGLKSQTIPSPTNDGRPWISMLAS